MWDQPDGDERLTGAREGAESEAAAIEAAAARRAEHNLRSVLAAMPDAIVGVNRDGVIELFNGQAEALFGWSAADIIGQPVETLVPVEVAGRHVAHRARYGADPSPRPMGAGLQLSARRRDGSTFPADISLSAVRDVEGPPMVLAAVRDVTERLELEEQRRRQEQEAQRDQAHRLESLGQLAGGIAHDFNNLLGVILNYSALLERQLDTPTARGDLGEIRGAAERAAGLTRRLLTFARRDQARPRPIDLRQVAAGVATMLERTLGAHIELRVDSAPEPVIALADPNQVEQIIVNLALNARDAMPSGGHITIATGPRSGPSSDGLGEGDPPQGQVQLVVTDDGEGMPAEVVDRVFEPFFTTKARGEGTGLGLPTVYGIARQSGGEVLIDSTVGAGTTVTVVLPRGESDQVTDVPAPAVVAPGGSETILVVEDTEPVRITTARLLTDAGYQVLVAGDGLEALEVLWEVGDRRVDLVLTDMAMPRLGGDDLADRLAELRPDLPVVFMTGYASGQPRPGTRVLTKPFSESELLAAVREGLDG